MLKKDVDFNWDSTYEAAVQHVKISVIGSTTLQYFNASHPLTVQVEAFQAGLELLFSRG